MRGFFTGCAAALAAGAALLIWPSAAAEGVRRALGVCGEVIIPSLFPFFVLGSALSALGLPQRLAVACSGGMSRLFGAPGAGAAALVMGLAGGYPLGAATAAQLVQSGAVTRAEGERLLGFCNNSGPAFLVGAAGAGVFGSARAGLALYAAHILAALTAGLLMRGYGSGIMSTCPSPPEPGRGVFVRAVTGSVGNVLRVCGFVVIFSALCSALDAAGLFPRLCGALAARAGLELGAARALLTGFFEIGGGVSSLAGCAATRANFALCALIIGWGGLSVHMQTAAAAAPAGLGMARHLCGRVLSAALSALYAAALFPAAF